MADHSAKKVERIRRSYQFLLAQEKAGAPFTVADIAAATGWKPGTVATYVKKKWGQLVVRTESGFRVSGVGAFAEGEFVRLMSQKDELSADPKKPQLAGGAEALVRKARESALLGLHIYNSPTTVFRTEGFSVMMVIAWTAMFHAIFEKRGTSYFYVDKKGVPILIDGDKKAWELGECASQFYGGAQPPARANLEFFIKLRNKIEHRYAPSIDAHVAGECQALLFNFDELLTAEFTTYYAIRETLAIPLQTATTRTVGHTDALRKLQARHFDEVKGFIDGYRSTLPSEIHDDQKYSFRVFFFPRVGNHQTSSDLAVEYVKFDPTRPSEMAALTKQIVAVRDRQVPVASAGLLKPTGVVKAVASKLGKPFLMHHHTLAWQRYSVRRVGKFDAAGCDTRYCIPDEPHEDYLYTKAWVELLVSKLSDASEYKALTTKPKKT
jgi:hypothetical protein